METTIDNALWTGELLLALALGLLIRLIVSMRTSSDDWGTGTKIAKHRGKRWLNYEMPDSLVAGIFPYPMLLHFLISRLPKSRWALASLVVNVGSDLVVGVAVGAVVMFGLDWGEAAGRSPHRYAFLGCLLFLTLPVLIPVTSRMRAGNGRAPGLVLTTVYFCCVALSIEQASVLWLVPAAVAAGAAFLTSFFAGQTLVFFSLLLSLFYLHWAPLVPVTAALAIGLLVPKIGIRDVVVFKVNHFIWYHRNRDKGTTAANRNLLGNVVAFSVSLITNRARASRLFLREAPLLIAVYSVPPIWFLVAALANLGVGETMGLSPIMKFCLLMVLCSTIAFLLTATGPLTIFGQAERYYEYSAPMLCVAVALLGVEAGFVSTHGILLLVIGQLAVVFLIHFMSSGRHQRGLAGRLDDSPELRELVEFLKQIPGEVRAATLPIKLPILLSAHTGNDRNSSIKYYYRFILNRDRKLDGFRYFEQDTERWDLFRSTPAELAAKYDLNTMIIETRFLNNRTSKFVGELRQLEPEFSNSSYQVFRLDVPRVKPDVR